MAKDKLRRTRFNKIVGPKIQHLREKWNLTREEMGQRLGLPRLTIWRWETAQQTINLPDAATLADFFKIKVDDLLSDDSIIIQSPMIIFDCEIVKAIPPKDGKKVKEINYCAGWRDFDNMGISVISAYDYVEDRYRIFCQDNFSEFQTLLEKRNVIVGFNSLAFDNKLCAANGIYVPAEKSYDILVEVWKAKGLGKTFNIKNSHRYLGLGLDNLVQINFEQKKTGNGELAPVFWQERKIGAVADYCLTDVWLTKMLMDRILETGQLLDSHKNSFGKILEVEKPEPVSCIL